MEFKKYSQMLMCKMQLFLGNEFELSLKEVTKNNGITLTGIMGKRKGQNACPTLYIDEFYCDTLDESDVEYLGMRLSSRFSELSESEPDNLEQYFKYEYVQEHLGIKLVNADANKELLMKSPYRRFHNLAIVYYYIIEDESIGGRGTIMIHNEHMKSWKLTEEQLYEAALLSAKKLLPYRLSSFKEVLVKLPGIEIEKLDLNMYVLTNNVNIFGASCVLYEEALAEYAEIVGQSYYVLPCSIHEVILIPESDAAGVKELARIVAEINQTELEREYYLSDSVYLYDINDKQIHWVC